MQRSFFKTFRLGTLTNSDVSVAIKRVQRMHSLFSVGTEATSQMASNYNFFNSRYMKLMIVKLQTMFVKLVSSLKQKSLANYKLNRINGTPKICFSLIEAFNQHSIYFYTYLIKQVVNVFKVRISGTNKNYVKNLNPALTKLLYSFFLLSKNNLFTSTKNKNILTHTRLFKTKFLNFLKLVKILTKNNSLHSNLTFLQAEDLSTGLSVKSNLNAASESSIFLSDFEEPSKIWTPSRFLKNYFLTYKKFNYGYNDNCFQLFIK